MRIACKLSCFFMQTYLCRFYSEYLASHACIEILHVFVSLPDALYKFLDDACKIQYG